MGADLEIEHGYIVGKDVKLRGAHVQLRRRSRSGATAQLMMAATLAEGTTVLDNVALEPDITVLGDVLVAVRRATSTGSARAGSTIHGVQRAAADRHHDHSRPHRGRDVRWPPRRSPAAAITLERCEPRAHRGRDRASSRRPAARSLREHRRGHDHAAAARPGAVDVTTAPFPGFPTDMQAQMMALCVDRRRHQRDHRHHLPRPLHARARAGAPRRRHPSSRATSRWCKGVERLQGAPGDGDRHPRQRGAGARGARRPTARRASRASTTSTAATSGSTRSWRSSAPASSARGTRTIPAAAAATISPTRRLSTVLLPARTSTPSNARNPARRRAGPEQIHLDPVARPGSAVQAS